jgi:Xaa-Pro aminopeptidase
MAYADRMRVETAARQTSRVDRLRGEIVAAGLDALVVSHLPNIQYLTSFTGTAAVLLVLPGASSLVVDFRYATAARTAVHAAGLLDAVEVLVAPSSVDDTAAGRLRASGAQRVGVESRWMSVARFNRLASLLATGASLPLASPAPAPSLVTTERLIESARAIKDDWEIATLREAGRRLARVAAGVPGVVREGRTEVEVAADIDALIRGAGFERPAFETIVASGPNGALPHARPGARRLAPGEGVVLDFGGVYDGYCVDLTRTVELGTASREWRRMADAVADAQQAAIAAVRPGVPVSEVDAAARDLLSRLGLGEAFGHATGHGLGLEVHEEPRIARQTDGQPDPLIEAGMVFTIEPGVYVEGIGGVRIEDDVLVTGTGCEVLTRG